MALARAVPLVGVKMRDLTPADLAAPPAPVVPSALTRIRDAHHNLARLMAEGHREVEISAMTGYSPSRLSILKADPAFSELLTHYERCVAERRDSASADAAALMGQVLTMGLQEQIARLAEDPESISNKDLNDLVERAADRSGLGKTSNVNVKVGIAERLQAARERIRDITAEVVEQ